MLMVTIKMRILQSYSVPNYFNSYADNTCLIDCLNKLEDVVHAEGYKGDFIGYSLHYSMSLMRRRAKLS